MAKPVQTRASVSIGSGLGEARMLELAEKASTNVDDAAGRIRLETRGPHATSFSVRDHVEGREVMRFDVVTDRSIGRTTARTAITSFQVKEGGVAALVPMAKKKLIGFSAYEAFLDWYVSAVVAEDRDAIVTLVDGKD
ncbi:hypothetical protein KIN34_12220 [Cellulomonas sp. DKR-3]|uniref:Uncharacterized protein n=1 Tax=Cellulomonas fulva TaxID=2835530 RepID=A0ABS5U122_9CELL|nr:hypothetical protein [Cellulomonas fulva]MBT0995046.1 hypothetical protein [Cellulomonas fulva]